MQTFFGWVKEFENDSARDFETSALPAFTNLLFALHPGVKSFRSVEGAHYCGGLRKPQFS
jgi:hypothetical protein